MAVQTLYRAQAFGPGAEMWVVPANETSPILKKMDWYLNFQLSKAHHHQTEQLAPQLRSILNENQLQDFAPAAADKPPLMIAAESFFPTQTIVETPITKNWIENIQKIWTGMNRPTLRIFLPTQISAEEFKSKWSGPATEDVTVVPL
jgi:hypothetical protein